MIPISAYLPLEVYLTRLLRVRIAIANLAIAMYMFTIYNFCSRRYSIILNEPKADEKVEN